MADSLVIEHEQPQPAVSATDASAETRISATSSPPSAIDAVIVPPRSSPLTEIFSGTGLGLLLGMIAGLSVSPVVSTLLGTLLTVVIGFLGMQSASGPSRMSPTGLRLGAFGFACVIGVLAGLYIRTTQPFESVHQSVENWTKAGYSPAQAREMVAFQKLGIKPKGQDLMSGAADVTKGSQSVLFNATGEGVECGGLNPDEFGNDPAKIIDAYGRRPKLKEISQAVAKVTSPENQLAILKAAYVLMCEGDGDK